MHAARIASTSCPRPRSKAGLAGWLRRSVPAGNALRPLHRPLTLYSSLTDAPPPGCPLKPARVPGLFAVLAATSSSAAAAKASRRGCPTAASSGTRDASRIHCVQSTVLLSVLPDRRRLPPSPVIALAGSGIGDSITPPKPPLSRHPARQSPPAQPARLTLPPCAAGTKMLAALFFFFQLSLSIEIGSRERKKGVS